MANTLKPYIDYEPAKSIWEMGTEYKPGQVFDYGEGQIEISSVGPDSVETTDGCVIPFTAIGLCEYRGLAYEAGLRRCTSSEVDLPANGSVWVDSEGNEAVVEQVTAILGPYTVETDKDPCLYLEEFFDKYTLVASGVRRHEDSTHYEFNEEDVVNAPSHYMLFPEHNLEVRQVCQRVLDNLDNSDMDMSSYEAGCFKEAVQYLLRCYGKGQWQDIEKSVAVLQFAINSYKARSVEAQDG